MWFDLICAAILVVFVVLGFKKGFLKSVCGLLSFVISVVVVFLCYDKITAWAETTKAGAFINEKVSGLINMPEIDPETVPELLRAPLEASVSATGNAVNTLAENFSAVIIGIISIILTIIIVKIGIKLIFKVFGVFARMPVLKQCNGILGGVFGAASGVFWVCIVVIAVTYLSVIPGAEILKEISEGSYVMEEVSNNEFMVSLLSGVNK